MHPAESPISICPSTLKVRMRKQMPQKAQARTRRKDIHLRKFNEEQESPIVSKFIIKHVNNQKPIARQALKHNQRSCDDIFFTLNLFSKFQPQLKSYVKLQNISKQRKYQTVSYLSGKLK